MSLKTIYGDIISSEAFDSYIDNLINRFYKILPLKEEGCTSIQTYLIKFQAELFGTQKLMVGLQDDVNFIRLYTILQFLIDKIDDPDVDIKIVKTEVFEAIDICKKLHRTYQTESEGGDNYAS